MGLDGPLSFGQSGLFTFFSRSGKRGKDGLPFSLEKELKVRIKAVKKTYHRDLAIKYQKNLDLACDVKEGEEWISLEGEMPVGFCPSAWSNLSPFVFSLAHGAERLYGDWMKNPRSALVSCNDGFRPVSFLLEVVEREEDYEEK